MTLLRQIINNYIILGIVKKKIGKTVENKSRICRRSCKKDHSGFRIIEITFGK